MAITSVGTLGTQNDRSRQELHLTVGSTCAVNDLVVIAVAKANTSTTDGATNEVQSVTDPTGANLWKKAGEYCNGQGSAGAGIVVAIWYSLITATISSGQKIYVFFDPGFRDRSAATAWRFTAGGDKAIAVVSPVQTAATDAGTAPSQSISGLSSKEYLFLRAEAAEETVVGTFTVSSSFTKLTAAVESDSNGAAINGEFRILTGTSATSAPSGTSAGKDRASLFIAMHETDASFVGAGMWTF
jgi:hypothetical protein